ncbi:MAG: Asp23/Gls24 family envelope stress response protein [Clostridia bacterium]|nr:Asp23/Gls24 family envelope stress response protein [Clostridia bacterium]
MHLLDQAGTGKSQRAQMVAKMKKTEYIIDDAILIKGNKVICGESAKKAATKIEAVKRALFSFDGQVEAMQKVFEEEKPESILILGTSDDMVQKIVKNLKLPKITETIYIEDVSSPEEIAAARSARMSGGKHVIPVPTFELKKDFSGYLLDPLQIFRWKDRNSAPVMMEKSIIRPTFSYLGKYYISDNVFKAIIEHVSENVDAIYKVQRVNVETTTYGVMIYIDVIVEYGVVVKPALADFKAKLKKEIDRLTAMNVIDIKISAKGLHVAKK